MLKIFSYCVHCLCAQYFVKKDNKWVCEQCKKPLQTARVAGTNVTGGKDDTSLRLSPR